VRGRRWEQGDGQGEVGARTGVRGTTERRPFERAAAPGLLVSAQRADVLACPARVLQSLCARAHSSPRVRRTCGSVEAGGGAMSEAVSISACSCSRFSPLSSRSSSTAWRLAVGGRLVGGLAVDGWRFWVSVRHTATAPLGGPVAPTRLPHDLQCPPQPSRSALRICPLDLPSKSCFKGIRITITPAPRCAGSRPAQSLGRALRAPRRRACRPRAWRRRAWPSPWGRPLRAVPSPWPPSCPAPPGTPEGEVSWGRTAGALRTVGSGLGAAVPTICNGWVGRREGEQGRQSDRGAVVALNLSPSHAGQAIVPCAPAFRV
jgi:hypothetical protein